MNLLEHHIEKIISVEDFRINAKWANKYKFIKATLVVNSYGIVRTVQRVFISDEWELVQKHGYYLA